MVSYRNARRLAILLVGLTVVLTGVAMLVLPGPGVVTILLGLAILAAEFAWARRWLKQIKETTGDARKGVSEWLRLEEAIRPPPLPARSAMPPVVVDDQGDEGPPDPADS